MIIGGIILDNRLHVSGLNDSHATNSKVDYDIYGNPLVSIFKKNFLREIEFTSTENSGWQSFQTVQALKNLEQTSSEFIIDIDGVSYLAVFSDGITVDKVFKTMPNRAENDFYKVNFRCIIIEEV